MKLHIVALFRVKENYIMDAIELFRKLVKETKQEEGCLQYELIEDKNNKGVFFIAELWESEEHLFNHDKSAHLADFRINSASLMESQPQVYKGFKVF
ncbi:MAG: antibiotic biosynthesis monooxygenase [Chryseobacterium sp. 39-10]|nr:antibiotic biosynthesis monooxygenase [Chryseobacterium sp.]OJV45860.1 MAG: antibiotic biosynthesis monooxygenase [Chryseobacterium sp. 39-10]